MGGKKTQAWFCDHQLSLTKILHERKDYYIFIWQVCMKRSHEFHMNKSHDFHMEQSCEFTWHKVSWLKKKKFKFWSQIFDILEKQSIGYCIRLINRTLCVWNMTVKYGEKKNTHVRNRKTNIKANVFYSMV